MIGVVCKDSEARVAHEFFELFKTPWELAVPGRSYEAVIATTESVPSSIATRLVLAYNSRPAKLDSEAQPVDRRGAPGLVCAWNGLEFPLYGNVGCFPAGRPEILRVKGRDENIATQTNDGATTVVRFGYDLFQEVEFLLSQGQPPIHAPIPTLDLHIALLRQCLWDAGIRFVEIPPVPAGHEFMACLTHDVDFVGIRSHKGDRTMWGFLFRALFGSLLRAIRGRMLWGRAVQNWKAAFSLPLVMLGSKPDFWLEFDRYVEIEKGLGSTFYFIPYRGRAGKRKDGSAPGHRAAKYELNDLTAEFAALAAQGCEIGVHGIDAWHDATSARDELSRLGKNTGRSIAGVRMHWLYFDQESPQALESAGFQYDSTFGYNEAVGFRAGTTQAFQPLSVDHLMELPLNIQDTALFYPDRMNLSEEVARERCVGIVQQMATHGGVLTINWHTRSLSPERLWLDFYLELLQAIKSGGPLFGTAQQHVEWFQARRKLRFEQVRFGDDAVMVKVAGPTSGTGPSFVLRVFDSKRSDARDRSSASHPIPMDTPLTANQEITIPLGAAVPVHRS